MDQQSFIYKFLLTPQFRIWRYLFVSTFFVIISLNQALVSYDTLFPILGSKIYIIIISTIMTYVGILLLTIRVFVPRFLYKGKYLAFAICILVDALIFTLVPNIVYMLYFDDHDFFTTIALIDNISAFVIFVLCIFGVIIPVFLRSWMMSNQQLSELKIKRELSLVEQLKEQINPSSFSKILNRSESLIETEPQKASEMLMKLAQLLRYQLYDCSRDKVLLTAELSFLRNFLDLEQLDYTIIEENNITNVHIPTSLLLPYLQRVISTLDDEKENHAIDISVSASNMSISIFSSVFGVKNTIVLDEELVKIRERFDTLYKSKYRLTKTSNDVLGKAEILLQLDRK